MKRYLYRGESCNFLIRHQIKNDKNKYLAKIFFVFVLLLLNIFKNICKIMSLFEEKIADLNARQKEVVKQHHGNILILAGAGTGKTTVITCRIAQMIKKTGISPENILAVTFTNRAAKEMKERTKSLVGEKLANLVTINTFHSFCMKILRNHIDKLGYNFKFLVLDSADQQGIIKECLASFPKGKTIESLDTYSILNQISSFKQQGLTPDDIKPKTTDELFYQEIYSLYCQKLFYMNMVDFDDLLLLTTKLWDGNLQILKKYQEKYQYIMVDEFQDTNTIQVVLLKQLCTKEKSNLCVVGDDDQSIYHWRGAKVENILNFPKLFSNTKLIKLEQNYRSTNTILSVANAIIKNNDQRYSKKLWSSKKDNVPVSLITAKDDEDEAKSIASMIAHKTSIKNIRAEDFAILYRSNKQSRILEQVLQEQRIPYHLIGDRSFYTRREIKDAIAYLRIIDNNLDDMSLLRIINTPNRGIGNTTVLKIRTYAENKKISLLQAMNEETFLITLDYKTREKIEDFLTICQKYNQPLNKMKTFHTAVKNYLREIGYIDGLVNIYKEKKEVRKRLENVTELIENLPQIQPQGNETALNAYLSSVNLAEDYSKKADKNKLGVSLLTVHSAKGLEYKTVFVIGLEQELFPHRNNIENGQVNEERRLFYVAVTRAKEKLYLSWVRNRKSYGNNTDRTRSQFIDEIPTQYLIKVSQKEINPTLSSNDIEDMIAKFKKKFG